MSVDGTNWTQVASLENLEAVDDLRTISLNQSVRAQYIKIEMDTDNVFATVSMVNIYEDTTKKQ